MTPTLNEKVMAGLAAISPQPVSSRQDGIDAAVRALRRFATLIEARSASKQVYPGRDRRCARGATTAARSSRCVKEAKPASRCAC